MRILRKTTLLVSLLGLMLLLAACGGDTPVSSPENPSDVEEPALAQPVGETMTIEGTIAEIMESWPLQLTVDAADGTIHVALLEETIITQNGESVAPGALTNGQKVRIEGESTGPNAMLAQSIEIQ